MDFKKALPLLAIPAGLIFLVQVARARAASITPVSYRLSFDTGKPLLYIKMRLVNPSDIPYTLSNIFLNVGLDNKNIGVISPGKSYDIPARANISLEMPMLINTAGLIDIVKEYADLRRNIRVTGVVYIGGVQMRINKMINV
jgi:hypothetical protein